MIAGCLAPMLTQNGKRRGRKPGLNSTLAQRSAANARERSRMRVLSSAFIELKGALPWVPKDTKLSKLDTLKLAAGYIAYLKRLLDSGEIDYIDFTDSNIIKKIDEQDNQDFIKIINIQGNKFNLNIANELELDSEDCPELEESREKSSSGFPNNQTEIFSSVSSFYDMPSSSSNDFYIYNSIENSKTTMIKDHSDHFPMNELKRSDSNHHFSKEVQFPLNSNSLDSSSSSIAIELVLPDSAWNNSTSYTRDYPIDFYSEPNSLVDPSRLCQN